MIIFYTEEFRRQHTRLPHNIQNFYAKQEAIFQENCRDPRLHVKKLIGGKLTFSFRVTRHYRVLFMFAGEDTAVFLTIGHRKSVYRS